MEEVTSNSEKIKSVSLAVIKLDSGRQGRQGRQARQAGRQAENSIA